MDKKSKESYAPLQLEELKFKRQQWLNHEKELSYIQEQFKPKLIKLQKMLVSCKSSLQEGNGHKERNFNSNKHNKLEYFHQNINKQIQRDQLIDKEMKKLTNQYDFAQIIPEATDEKHNEKLQYLMESLITKTYEDLSLKEQKIETIAQDGQREGEYQMKIDELGQLKQIAVALEHTQGNLQKSLMKLTKLSQLNKQQDQEIKIKDTSLDNIESYHRQMSENVSIQLYEEELQKQIEYEKKLAKTVLKEQLRIGMVKSKNVMSMNEFRAYLEDFKQQSQPDDINENPIPLRRIKIPQITMFSSEQKQLTSITTPQSVTIQKQVDQSIGQKQMTLPQIGQQPIHNLAEFDALDDLISDCNVVKKSMKGLNFSIAKKQRRVQMKLKSLDKKLNTIKISNFLENKLILI